jgi:glycine/D-amino acid oxidase-like deaminating enzyme/nitrite reductase/ring-hydroxylating ferredoxin subunit
MQIYEKTYWQDTCEGPDYERLKGDQKCDIAIIGAGITGITTAMLLADSGMSIAVVEADKVCSGTTGKTTGKITFEHGLKLSSIRDRLGEEYAKSYALANKLGLDQIAKLIDKYDIDCDYTELPAYVYTKSQEGMNKFEEEIGIMQKFGINASIVDNTALPVGMMAALMVEDQAQFNPIKYVTKLAEVLAGYDNCTIYEQSMVTSIDKGSPCKVYTDSGTLEADILVVATNYPIIDIPGLMFTKIHQQKSYIIATPAQGLDIAGMYINDEDPVESFRMDYASGGNMLLIGGYGHKAGQEAPQNSYAKLKELLQEKLMQKTIPYMYQWGAQDCISLDDIPYIGKLSKKTPNIYIGTGYGKWGMTNGTAAAMLIANDINGHNNKLKKISAVFSPQRFTLKGSAKEFVAQAVDTTKELIKGITAPKGSLEDITKGDGMVMKVNGKKMAVYRDENNNLKVLEPFCTHLGCLLEFNSNDKTWDCPCHGSRFDTSGNVIEGPAQQPLEIIDIEDTQ